MNRSWTLGVADFDTLYAVRVTRSGSAITATFEHSDDGRNGLPTTCP